MPPGLLLSLLLVDFADEWLTFLPFGAIESIRADVGLSYTQAGAILTLLPAGGIAGMFATVAADFVSRRALAAGGALVYGGCLVAFALADSFAVLAVAAFTWGAASDAFVHGAQVALVDVAGDELDGALARTNLLGSIGDLLGPVTVAAAAAAGLGWRPVFAAGGVAMLGYGGWLASKALPPPRPNRHTPSSAIAAVARDRRVWWFGAFLAVGDVLDEPFLGFLVALLQGARGASSAVAALVVGAALAGSVGGYVHLARRSSPLPEGRALVGATALKLVAIPGMLFAPSLAVVAVAAVGAGFAGAVLWVTIQAAVLRLRPGQSGTTWAVVATISLPGLAWAPLVGAAADRFGIEAAVALYLVAPILMLALLAVRPGRLVRSLG